MSSVSNSSEIPQFPVLLPTIQIDFYKRLVKAQSENLLPALLARVDNLNILDLDQELHVYAGEEKLKYLALKGLRGELLFPVPYLLTGKPALLAYYRMLLGFSQKEFFRYPFSIFTKMETRGLITSKAFPLLPQLSISLIESSWILAKEIPNLSRDILESLTLLTFGSQLRGSYNTRLGKGATKLVFDLIRQIVLPAIEEEEASSILIRNAAGRRVRIAFSPDPDIAIREQLGSGKFNNRIAIEIKGGRDISNIHNRLGEAEISHQNAKDKGFTQFWTIVNVPRLVLDVARRESPTTTAFFTIENISDENSPEHSEFKELLLAELGLSSS